jgi:large conductance mechanosensitive channel
MLQEFKAFAMRGNVVDMAVGVVIGASFGKIVSALVDNVIMPPIGLLIGGVDFSDLKVILKTAEGAEPAVSLGYGMFVQTAFDFTIVAFAMFMIVKFMNKMKKADEVPAAPPAPLRQEVLLEEIRDLLKSK